MLCTVCLMVLLSYFFLSIIISSLFRSSPSGLAIQLLFNPEPEDLYAAPAPGEVEKKEGGVSGGVVDSRSSIIDGAEGGGCGGYVGVAGPPS